MASGGKLDKVYADMAGLREMMEASPHFKMMVETPGIDPESKVKALEAVCKKAGTEAAVVNFLKVLVENKRIAKLCRIVDLFEAAAGPPHASVFRRPGALPILKNMFGLVCVVARCAPAAA